MDESCISVQEATDRWHNCSNASFSIYAMLGCQPN